MRLLAWNCNCSAKQREPAGALWVGANGPGLAVVVRADLRLIAHPANVDAPSLMCGFSVRGPWNSICLRL